MDLSIIDENIREHVRILNEKGYCTRYSCESHWESNMRHMYISFSSAEDFRYLCNTVGIPEGFSVRRGSLVLEHLDYESTSQEEFEEKKTGALSTLLSWCRELPRLEKPTYNHEYWEAKHKEVDILIADSEKRRGKPIPEFWKSVIHSTDFLYSFPCIDQAPDYYEKTLAEVIQQHCPDADVSSEEALESTVCRLARDYHTPHAVLERIAQECYENDDPSFELQDLAVNPSTPPFFLDLFAHDEYLYSELFEHNPAIPESIQLMLAQEDSDSPEFIIDYPNAAPSALLTLAELYCVDALAHPNLRGDVLREYAALDDRSVDMALAQNPNTPVDLLVSFSEHADLDMSSVLLNNPSVPEKCKENIRATILENPFIPEYIKQYYRN